jgi:hypothetical protein
VAVASDTSATGACESMLGFHADCNTQQSCSMLVQPQEPVLSTDKFRRSHRCLPYVSLMVHTFVNLLTELLEWTGSAPICAAKALLGTPFFYSAASCPSDHPDTLTTGKEGAGGEQQCARLGGELH